MKGMIGALLFLLLPPLLSAQDDPFRTVRDRFRDGSPAEEALQALEALNSPDLVYDGSRAFFEVEYLRLKGQYLITAERQDEARAALEESLDLAERENEIRETSRSLLYISSVSFLLAGLDGIKGIISRSGEINDTLDKALLLDGSDPEILYQRAASLAFAPKLFGGDPPRAITMLEYALNGSNPSAPLRFDLLTVLSHCYDREKRSKDALDAADDALALYPRNPIMIEKRKELEKKVK